MENQNLGFRSRICLQTPFFSSVRNFARARVTKKILGPGNRLMLVFSRRFFCASDSSYTKDPSTPSESLIAKDGNAGSAFEKNSTSYRRSTRGADN